MTLDSPRGIFSLPFQQKSLPVLEMEAVKWESIAEKANWSRRVSSLNNLGGGGECSLVNR